MNNNIQVVVAAGGFGTRMASITIHQPKILAPIKDGVFLDYFLNKWAEYGCTHMHFLLGYGATIIWERIQEWKIKFNSIIYFSATIEHTPLGVIGALNFAKSSLLSEFILTYGDVYPTILPDNLFKNMDNQSIGCLAICHKDISNEPPNIEIKNGKITKYKKHAKGLTYVDLGMILIKKRALEVLPDQPLRLSESSLYEPLAKKELLSVYIHNTSSIHIGDPEAYDNFINHIIK
jgi:NDP-sugar pyrophosphorylase family protein